MRGLQAQVRILIVTQMWPSAADPDFGAFLVPQVEALREQGHEVEVVAIDRRGGSPLKHGRLTLQAVRAARRFRPDAVLAHMLFPAGFAGLAAARAARAPLVVMAHGQDVANCERPALRAATRFVVSRAAAVVANSRWLERRLQRHLPDVTAEIIDLGVDMARFDGAPERAVEWPGPRPRLLCVGSLLPRKNVVPLADAFARLGAGSLVFVGDGPQRAELEGRPGVTVVGRVPHDEVPAWVAACDVLCQPSEQEPFGLAALEAMAAGRSVVATTEGGPPEFVPPEAGVLVKPGDPDALLDALRRAIALPSPNPAARAAAAEHDVRRQARRMAEVLRRAAEERPA